MLSPLSGVGADFTCCLFKSSSANLPCRSFTVLLDSDGYVTLVMVMLPWLWLCYLGDGYVTLVMVMLPW